MTFEEGDHVLGSLWFTWGDGDYLLTVVKKKGDTEWTGEYRFRYYEDDRAHHSNDRKSFWGFKVDREGAVLWEQMKQLAIIAAVGKGVDPSTIDEIFTDGDFRAHFEKMKTRPWVHMRQEEKPS